MSSVKKIHTAFTLIELLVVIVIIGILATISIATWRGNIDTAQEGKQLAEDTQEYQRLLAECVLAGRTDCASITVGGFVGPSGVCGKKPLYANGSTYNAAGEVFETNKTALEMESYCADACTLNAFYIKWLNSATTPYYGHIWTGTNMMMYVCYPFKIQSGHTCAQMTTPTTVFLYDAADRATITNNGIVYPTGLGSGLGGSSQAVVEAYCSSQCALGTFTMEPRIPGWPNATFFWCN